MVPIPQYPLYTATLSVLDARCVPYYLNEKEAWGTSLDEIRSAYDKAVSEGTDVKAIVVINPGNPTGASLSAEDIKSVLKFAAEKSLVVMADEVYQTNVFIGEFISFKKALRDLQKESPGKYDNLELASLHSVSKGMVGECGHRGGYFELIGFDPEVAQEVYKFISIQLCPPVLGQCIVEMMVNPPKEGEPSYELYKQEYDSIFNGLKERAYALYEAFKQMEGVECDKPQVCKCLFSPWIRVPRVSCHPGINRENRDPCTSSPRSTYRQRLLSKRRRRAVSPMNSTASACWMLLASVSLQDPDSARGKAHYTSERRSSHQAQTGLDGSSSSIKTLWLNLNELYFEK